MSSQKSFMPKREKGTEALLRLALKVDADDGQVYIWKRSAATWHSGAKKGVGIPLPTPPPPREGRKTIGFLP